MKIQSDKTVSLLDALVKSANNKPTKEAAVDGKSYKGSYDKVELSTRKQEIESIRERIKASPAVRQDKVDQMKEALTAQTYNVKGELVAKSMLKSSLLDEIL